MSWYQRTKLGFHSLRRSTNSKVLPRPHAFSGFHPSVGLGSLTSLRNTNRFAEYGKRFYSKVHHPKPGEPTPFQTKIISSVVLISFGGLITLCFAKSETVPYTKRTHLILLSKSMEKWLGKYFFKKIKKQYKGKILPDTHPDTIRVRSIAKEIIDGLQRGLSHERVWSDLGHASLDSSTMTGSKNDQILDDKWTSKKDSPVATSHLDGISWEVLVVDDTTVNAFCLPAGKIVVFTGLLKHFNSDAEIATVIGHEVGHAVARHVAEQLTKHFWLSILQTVLNEYITTPGVVKTMSNLFLDLPFSRAMEIEADYIGIMLLASAGYDPRIAPKLFEKMGKLGGDEALEYLSTHPSGKKRSQLLAQANVMEEALTIYKEVHAGRGIEGVL